MGRGASPLTDLILDFEGAVDREELIFTAGILAEALHGTPATKSKKQGETDHGTVLIS